MVIIDGSVRPQIYGPSFGVIQVELGEHIDLVMANGSHVNVTVVGIMDQSFNLAVFSSNDFILDNSPVQSWNLFYVSTSKQSDMTDQQVANQLEKAFIEYGFDVVVVRDTIKSLMNMISSMMQLMEILLGMGLIVGISGLGIITIRSVAERRQEIGVMRAIGYQRDMILRTFMLETSLDDPLRRSRPPDHRHEVSRERGRPRGSLCVERWPGYLGHLPSAGGIP